MSWTRMMITGCVITLGIYDLLAVFYGGLPSTVSKTMQNAGLDAPFVVFATGFVCGHIFGYMPPDRKCD